MAERQQPTNLFEKYTAAQLAQSIHIQTSAVMGYEDGRPNPLEAGWEGSRPLPSQLDRERELMTRIENGVSGSETTIIIKSLTNTQKLLENNKPNLTKDQESALKRAGVIVEFAQGSNRNARSNEALSLPYSGLQVSNVSPFIDQPYSQRGK